MGKQQVCDKILEYYEQVLKLKPTMFTHNKEADMLIKQDSTAFLFACILDQGAVAERIWEIPYHLKRIWGHLDPSKIALMSEEELYGAFQSLPGKPRYWKTAARRLKSASVLLANRYSGAANNIWNDNPRAGDLHARLDAFEGVAQKKASMATRILAMDLKVLMRNWEEIDVSVDEMIMRVFPRAGLSISSNPKEIIEAARQLNPSFPGALDYPCWMIGRQWCQPQSPRCGSCYIGSVCPKVGV
jgi:endonuclease III